MDKLLPVYWIEFLQDSWAQLPALPVLPMAGWVGLALLTAVWLGERLQRAGMARTMGYWLCGAGFGIALVWAQMVMGQQVLAGTSASAPGQVAAQLADAVANAKGAPSTWATLQSLSWIFDLALGWVLVELGQRIDLRWLRRNRALAATAVLEFALTWLLAALALRSLGLGWLPAGVAATLAAHSSPVLLSTLLPQWRAEGQVTERALHLGSINTVLTAITLPVVLALVGAYAQGETAVAGSGLPAAAPGVAGGLSGTSVLRSGLELAQPLWEVVASLAIGFAMGWLLSSLRQGALVRRTNNVRSAKGDGVSAGLQIAPSGQWLTMLGAVCVAVGLAQWVGAPALVACLALGLSVRRRAALASLADMSGAGVSLGQLAQVLMFIVAGASLPWLQWAGLQPDQPASALSAPVWILAVLLILIRLCAKTLVCTLTARWAGLRWVQGLALGLMLQPLSMTGLVLWAMAASALAAPYAMLSHAVLLMLCASDVLAPWLMHAVLRSMREVQSAPVLSVALAPDARWSPSSGLQTQSSVQAQRVDTHTDLGLHTHHVLG